MFCRKCGIKIAADYSASVTLRAGDHDYRDYCLPCFTKLVADDVAETQQLAFSYSLAQSLPKGDG